MTAWIPPVSAVHVHFTDANHSIFKDCSHEPVLKDEMKAMIRPETVVVQLDSCGFHSIPDDVCDGLPNLEEAVMRVNSNKVTEKTVAGFYCVKYLTIYTVVSNSTIEDGAFGGLKKLENLYLNGISMSDIPEDLLNGPIPSKVLKVDGILIRGPASDNDITTAKGTSTSGHARSGCVMCCFFTAFCPCPH